MGGSKSPTSTASTSGQIFAPRATLPNAKPPVMQATLPTAADYAVNRMAVPQAGSMREARQNYAAGLLANNQLYGQPEKERNAQLIAQLAQSGISSATDAITKALSSQQQAAGASEWANFQRQSSARDSMPTMRSYPMQTSGKPSGNAFNFQPDDLQGYQIADDKRRAIDMAIAERDYMLKKAKLDSAALNAASKNQLTAAWVNALGNVASSGLSAYSNRFAG